MATHQGAQEGVIKFGLDFEESRPWAKATDLAELDAWRKILVDLRLLGQDPGRYEGFGFGNVSRRLVAAERRRLAQGGRTIGSDTFWISATQTGHLARLLPENWVLVEETAIAQNRVRALGSARPSSESLTHAAIYALDPKIKAVLHVHSPEIFLHATALELPQTAADVPYGTPAMAAEVARLYREGRLAGGIFVMAGHDDGVVAFGPTLPTTGRRLIEVLARALRICDAAEGSKIATTPVASSIGDDRREKLRAAALRFRQSMSQEFRQMTSEEIMDFLRSDSEPLARDQ